MTINVRHQGVLEITVAPHIDKCCNKAITPTGFFDEKRQIKIFNTPYANMLDHSVVTWNKLYESEASWASVFCFDNASSEKSCFVRDLLVFFVSRFLHDFNFKVRSP